MTNEPGKVAILIESGFSLLAYASIVSALSATNSAAAETRFQWRIVSSSGAPMNSDSGTVTKTMLAHDGAQTQRSGSKDRILVLLSKVLDADRRKLILAWIRECLSHGAKVLSVGSGTEMLCEEGFMNGRRCSVHWSEFGVALEKFPRAIISRAFFEADGPFFTCAGEFSTFDVVMKMIARDIAPSILDIVSALVLQNPPRGQAERQCVPDHVRLQRMGSPLLQIVELMDESIFEPLPIADLFHSAKISRRQAERLFDKHMGTSPKRFYLRLRLERARDLLRHTEMQISDIAVATGFVSHSHFSKTFKAEFGVLPTETRRAAT